MLDIPTQLQNENFKFCKIKNGTKGPEEKAWQAWNNYFYYDDAFREGRDAYGVVCGIGFLYVIDFDNLEIQEKLMKNLPPTFSVRTGGKGLLHLYFTDKSKLPLSYQIDKDGKRIVDIQGTGKQVIGPGSIHATSKKLYEVANDMPIAELSQKELLDFLKEINFDYKLYGGSGLSSNAKLNLCKFHDDHDPSMAIYKDNGTFYCFSCRAHGFIEALNFTGKLLKKETKNGVFYYIEKEDIDKYKKLMNSVKEEIKTKIIEEKISPFLFFSQEDDEKPKFVPKLLGDYLLNKFNFKTIRGNDKQIYYYKDGYYQENGISIIKEQATFLLDSFFRDHYVYETLSYIRNSTYIEADQINNEWINLKNGLLNPITKEFKEHTPTIFCLQQLPIDYDINATCPIWTEQLKSKCDPEWKYDLTQEIFGYCFLHDNRFEKAFLLYGEPKTMKSTTLYILIQLLGEENVTAMSLQYLTEDKHGPAFLFGCPANICPDLSARELKNTSVFLKVIGQDPITYGKKFEQEITFSPFTKLIFSCNVIPSTTNKNNAFYRRWCLMEYNIQTPEDKVNPDMRELFLNELSGILNWSLEGLDRLLKNNKLSYPLSIEETKDLYERNSDSISSFILNEIDCDYDEGELKKRDVYRNYKEYCKNNTLNCANQIYFGKKFFEITGCGSKRIGNIPGYTGVTWKGFREEFNNEVKEKKVHVAKKGTLKEYEEEFVD